MIFSHVNKCRKYTHVRQSRGAPDDKNGARSIRLYQELLRRWTGRCPLVLRLGHDFRHQEAARGDGHRGAIDLEREGDENPKQ